MFHGFDDDDEVVTPKAPPPLFEDEIRAPPTPSVRQLAAASLPPPIDGDVEEMTLPSTPIPSIIPLPLGPSEPKRVKKSYGSEARYSERLQAFRRDGESFPWFRHYFYWLLHNLIAHPILGIFPGAKAVDLHDLTSAWLNKHNPVLRAPVPVITDDQAWLVHNLVAHVAIGLLPCKWTFAFHDWSAKRMGVPGWV